MDINKYLYTRGYLITNSPKIKTTDITDFYNVNKLDKYYIYTHNDTRFYYIKKDNFIAFLIGHAYNPFTDEYCETDILLSIFSKNNSSQNGINDYINELTGTFVLGTIINNKLTIINDASGIQTCFYGLKDDYVYISSHLVLLERLLMLERTKYSKKLIRSEERRVGKECRSW